MLEFKDLLALPSDAQSLFVTRAIRLFAYGLVGVILVLFVKELGLSDTSVGSFLTLTLIGDALVSLYVTGNADHMGRRFMLVLGCALMAFAGLAFALLPSFSVFDAWLSGTDVAKDMAGWQGWIFYLIVVLIGTVGVISPSGNEVGPFMALEQSVLSNFIPAASRATSFAWYNLIGYVSTAFGSLFAGLLISYLTETSILSAVFSITMLVESPTQFHMSQNSTIPDASMSKLNSYRIIIALYGVFGILLAVAFMKLTSKVEIERIQESVTASERTPLLSGSVSQTPVATQQQRRSWLPGFASLSTESRFTVVKLCFLFTLDSFAGACVTGSILAYWFKYKFGVDEAYLGGVLFGSNIIAGVSSLFAGWISNKIGMVNTMVVTHLPSNVLMLMVPLMPNL
ncbi:hypothetical protein HDU99_001773 [Rhizoclosmatium hyalinum]|nr:hypothetical protein HDU99_001773 [Rhizoclosmatium hyalinum]